VPAAPAWKTLTESTANSARGIPKVIATQPGTEDLGQRAQAVVERQCRRQPLALHEVGDDRRLGHALERGEAGQQPAERVQRQHRWLPGEGRHRQPPGRQEHSDLVERQKPPAVHAVGDRAANDTTTSTDPAPGAGERNAAKMDAVQPHESQAPTEPLESTAGPQDALEPGQIVSQGVRVDVGGSHRHDGPGSEDAMDPAANNLGDYADRVDDAHHYTHQPVTDPKVGGPLSVPVAQNERAQRALDEQTPSPAATAETTDGYDPEPDEDESKRAAAEQREQGTGGSPTPPVGVSSNA
jgi:hypothetical protein